MNPLSEVSWPTRFLLALLRRRSDVLELHITIKRPSHIPPDIDEIYDDPFTRAHLSNCWAMESSNLGSERE
jgi:hypothetical protein